MIAQTDNKFFLFFFLEQTKGCFPVWSISIQTTYDEMKFPSLDDPVIFLMNFAVMESQYGNLNWIQDLNRRSEIFLTAEE